MATVPLLVRAKAQDVPADVLNCEKRPDSQAEMEELEECANRIFEACGHAFGTLDITMRKACREKDVEKINQCLEKYENMEYFQGSKVALGLVFDVAISLSMSDLQQEIADKLETLSRRTGGKLLGLMFRVQRLAVFNLPGRNDGKVITGTQELYTELSRTECSYLRGQAAFIAAQAYKRTRRYENALVWAGKCCHSWVDATATDRSSAKTLTMSLWSDQTGTTKEDEQRLQTSLLYIEEDISQECFANALEKIQIVLPTLIMYRSVHMSLIKKLQQVQEQLIRQLPEQDRKMHTANDLQTQAQFVIADIKGSRLTEPEQAATELLEKAVKLYLSRNNLYAAANSRQMQGLCYFSIYRKDWGGQAFEAAARSLQRALDLFKCAEEAFNTIGATSQAGTAAYWVAFCSYAALMHGWVTEEELLEKLGHATTFIQHESIEVSFLAGLDSVLSKQNLIGDKHTRNLHSFALQIHLKGQSAESVWELTQKSKARSLVETIGGRLHAPANLIDKINRNNTAKSLYEQEMGLMNEIKTGDMYARFPARVRLEGHRAEMRKHDELKELLELRDGAGLTVEKLDDLMSDLTYDAPDQREVVFVDWVVMGEEIHILTVESGSSPVMQSLPITYTAVKEWIKENYLDTESRRGTLYELNDDFNPLRQLDPLVGPLGQLSNTGDILIFCPTGILHSLPLHVLLVSCRGSTTTVIERNPVVFCTSLTALAQCCKQTKQRQPTAVHDLTVVAVYEPVALEEFDDTEQCRIYESAQRTAEFSLSKHLLLGQEVSVNAFESVVGSSHILFFHGHCDRTGPSIKQQSLRLVGDSNNQGKSI